MLPRCGTLGVLVPQKLVNHLLYKMKIDFDFRLLDVSLELHALEDQYLLIENQLSDLNAFEEGVLIEYRRKHNLNQDDPEWDISRQEFHHKVEFLLPRFFWNPFMFSLYAVFETSVIEIANLLKESQGQGIGINDLKGNFLERAKKYYKNVINFQLHNCTRSWQQVTILTDVRHVIAHSNGRLDMLNDSLRNKIGNYQGQKCGLDSHYNFLIIEPNFAKSTFNAVKHILEDLVQRYKEYDDKK